MTPEDARSVVEITLEAYQRLPRYSSEGLFQRYHRALPRATFSELSRLLHINRSVWLIRSVGGTNTGPEIVDATKHMAVYSQVVALLDEMEFLTDSVQGVGAALEYWASHGRDGAEELNKAMKAGVVAWAAANGTLPRPGDDPLVPDLPRTEH
jgi:hypothetical protein